MMAVSLSRTLRAALRGLTAILSAAALVCGLASCENDLSPVGGSLAAGEVTITADSLDCALTAKTVERTTIDGRNAVKLLGRISVPQYGALRCSFVSQMLSATAMNIPDSITEADLDSMRLVLSVPRGSLTGDSLTPQQLRVYRLSKQLPSPITSTFDPAGYYDASTLMGKAVYTLSNIAKGDSAMKNEPYIRVPVQLPMSFARELFRMYRKGDPVFQWPATFNKFFPGIYVEQDFGNGCIANISRAEAFTYWHRKVTTYDMQPDSTFKYVEHIRRDSVCLLASQPEVLSSNIIDYRLSDYLRGMAASGKSIVTTPGGYEVEFDFPAQRLIDQFRDAGTALSMVSGLSLSIPADDIDNDHGIYLAPWLLMVKKSERDAFFAENRIPDNKSAFYAQFNAETGSYRFGGMRSWLIDLIAKAEAGDQITAEDTEFVLVPVEITTEVVENYNSTITYVTRCQPYLAKPTMTLLHTGRAKVAFTYTSQSLE